MNGTTLGVAENPAAEGARPMFKAARMFVPGMAAGLIAASAATATSPPAATLQVCPSCQFSQIAPAIAAATSGDTVNVAAGTYQGGFTIAVTMNLVGAGAGATVISGGGPVITIGPAATSSTLTVSISGVTITGGVTHSSLGSSPAGVIAAGGGVEIPANGIGPAGVVTISHSVITGNLVMPTASTPSGPNYPCPGGQCPFNEAHGGGIDNNGVLTLRDSTVTDNQAVGVNGQGGGIYSTGTGRLTLIGATVTRNQALAPTSMVGRYAEGGGIFAAAGGTLTVMHSVVSHNTSSLTSTLPVTAGGQTINMVANGGGIHADDGASTTIENTTINDNSVSAIDPGGPANAINAAIQVGQLTMDNSVISHNRVSSTTATDGVTDPSPTAFDTGGQGGTLEVDEGGTISHSRITDNSSTSTSAHGPVDENSGLDLFPPGDSSPARLLTVQDSVISGNTATATSGSGSATVQGVGILNTSLLRLVADQVRDNSGHATGKTALAQGAGIWNGSSAGPNSTVRLALDHTVVTHNSLTAGPGDTVQGAGLFTIPPVTLKASTITANNPGNCSGTSC